MIGIMSAMQEEIQTLHHHLKNPKSFTKGRRTYHSGSLFGKEVVLVFSRIGKVASATTATQLINDFDLTELIFTGVAGALDPNLNIGDIVIGNQLAQYDMDASPLFPPFEIPLLNKTLFKTNASRREKLTKASHEFIKDYHKVISEKEAKDLKINHPKLIIGDMASGDQFVSKAAQVDFIINNFPSVVCVEMEGAAVAQVCYEYDLPFSIMRTISDKTNDDSSVDFPMFIKNIASKYALEILQNYLK